MRECKTWSYNFNQIEYLIEDEEYLYDNKDKKIQDKIFDFLESQDFTITLPTNKRDAYF